MDILEKKEKSQFDNDLKDIIKILKFKNNPIELKGSSSLKSQKYFSDYDLFTNIILNYGVDEVYDEFRKILNNIISSYDLYFIEFKIQTKKGKKYRWFPNDDFKYEDFKKAFKDVDFAKIDIVSRTVNIFIEVSCIYKFSQDVLPTEEYISSLNKDIKELKKEGNYYKILKRLFNIFKLENNIHNIEMLTKVFNSELGKQYKTISNLEAIESLKKYYKDADTNKKIEINLTDINEPHTENNLKKYKNELNDKAKKIYNHLTI
jgi:hypothetical protein